MRPGLIRASSKRSARLVAPTTKIPDVFLKPSRATSNSLRVLSLSLPDVSPSPERLRPKASNSSIKIMHVIFFLAN